MRKMVQSKLKDMPADQREKIINAIEKNPDFFAKMASEIQTKSKGGKNQMEVAMEVMKDKQEEIKKILG